MNEWKKVGLSGKTDGSLLFENRRDGTTIERLDWRKYLTTREAAAYIGSTPA
jgi:hypothetical protein